MQYFLASEHVKRAWGLRFLGVGHVLSGGRDERVHLQDLHSPTISAVMVMSTLES